MGRGCQDNSPYPVNIGGHRLSVSEDMMIYICHVTLLDHVIKTLYDY